MSQWNNSFPLSMAYNNAARRFALNVLLATNHEKKLFHCDIHQDFSAFRNMTELIVAAGEVAWHPGSLLEIDVENVATTNTSTGPQPHCLMLSMRFPWRIRLLNPSPPPCWGPLFFSVAPCRRKESLMLSLCDVPPSVQLSVRGWTPPPLGVFTPNNFANNGSVPSCEWSKARHNATKHCSIVVYHSDFHKEKKSYLPVTLVTAIASPIHNAAKWCSITSIS